MSIQTVSGPLCLWFFFRFGCAITIKMVKDTELSTFDSFTTKQGGGTPYLLCLLTNKMLLYLYRSIFIKVFVSFCRRLNWNFGRKYKNQIDFYLSLTNLIKFSFDLQICILRLTIIYCQKKLLNWKKIVYNKKKMVKSLSVHLAAKIV